MPGAFSLPGVFAAGTVTWTFAELTSSGSVSFRTTVDPETISLTGPTVNTAVIDSNETEPDDGEDSVTVTNEGTAGGNPPGEPEVPDTAMGALVQLPAVALTLPMLVALGALLTVRLARRR